RNNTLSLDRSKSGIPIQGEEENTNIRTYKLPNNSIVNLDIFIDISSIEVFINDGQAVLTANVYPDELDQGIEFFTSGLTKVLSVVKYDISTGK
ncbi:MAG: GH32 C-terminal domain-containing protein, partial [Faecalicoccus sp.]|nr:GH32 C-terminal domain-containing protein [Faecalicoccus sp.]